MATDVTNNDPIYPISLVSVSEDPINATMYLNASEIRGFIYYSSHKDLLDNISDKELEIISLKATEMIENAFSFRGPKADNFQKLSFPILRKQKDADGNITKSSFFPTGVKLAVSEIILDMVDPLEEFDTNIVKSKQAGDLKIEYVVYNGVTLPKKAVDYLRKWISVVIPKSRSPFPKIF